MPRQSFGLMVGYCSISWPSRDIAPLWLVFVSTSGFAMRFRDALDIAQRPFQSRAGCPIGYFGDPRPDLSQNSRKTVVVKFLLVPSKSLYYETIVLYYSLEAQGKSLEWYPGPVLRITPGDASQMT